MIKNNFFKFAVFCFVGGTSALIHLIVYYIFFNFVFTNLSVFSMLIFGASLNHIASYFIAAAISMTYNFSFNRNITFSAKNESVKKQIPKYLVVYGFSIAIGSIVSIIAINLIGEGGFNSLIATLLGIVASIPISFLGSFLWTFRKNQIYH